MGGIGGGDGGMVALSLSLSDGKTWSKQGTEAAMVEGSTGAIDKWVTVLYTHDHSGNGNCREQ